MLFDIPGELVINDLLKDLCCSIEYGDWAKVGLHIAEISRVSNLHTILH